MKKLVLLSLFLVGCFVATQAQISYSITNSTGETWKFNTPYAPTVGVPGNGTPVTGTFPDAVVLGDPWSAFGVTSGCTAANTFFVTGTISEVLVGCSGTPPTFRWSLTGASPTYLMTINIY
jgi:hypothetical protein